MEPKGWSNQPNQKGMGRAGMGRLIKAVLILVVLGFAGLVSYAYLADLAPESTDVKVPVILNAE